MASDSNDTVKVNKFSENEVLKKVHRDISSAKNYYSTKKQKNGPKIKYKPKKLLKNVKSNNHTTSNDLSSKSKDDKSFSALMKLGGNGKNPYPKSTDNVNCPSKLVTNNKNTNRPNKGGKNKKNYNKYITHVHNPIKSSPDSINESENADDKVPSNGAISEPTSPGADFSVIYPSEFIINSFSDLSNVYKVSKILDENLQRWLRHVQKVAEEEKPMIESAIKRFEDVVYKVLHNAKIFVFGSYSSSLRLPHGDVDLTIKGADGSPVDILKSLIKHIRPIAHNREVFVILSARIPIIRYTDAVSGTKIDVNANPGASLKSTKVINNWIEIFPSVEPLIKINKHLIRNFDLNDTALGGIGSFLLFHMCFAFYLNFGESCKINESYSDGFAILCLWKYYGMLHNYKKFGIGPNGEIIPIPTSNQNGALKLVAYSPVNTTMEIGKRAHQMSKVIALFRHALSACLSITEGKVEPYNCDTLQFLFSDSYSKGSDKHIFDLNIAKE